MSTHNICFRRKIRKILCGYPLLSVAMKYPENYIFHHQNMLSEGKAGTINWIINIIN